MENFTPEIEDLIIERLKKGKNIRRFLPRNGILHIDRPLPFLYVYRYTEDGYQQLSAKLAETEASYLLIPENLTDEIKPLVVKIVKLLAEKFNAFLLMEIWVAPQFDEELGRTDYPRFTIYGPQESLPATLTTLKEALMKINISNYPVEVEVSSTHERHPDNMHAFLTDEERQELNCLNIGLEIFPFFINPETDKIYPVLFRLFRSKLSIVFKKTVFDFVRLQTPFKYTNYHMFGRQAVLKSVWKADDELVEISDSFKFLMLVTPLNTTEAWHVFRDKQFEETPVFLYRLLPVDPEIIKRRLYNIPVEKIDDPTLSYLFRDKRHEIDRMVTMLSDRESKNFLYGSLQLYGGVNNKLVKLAEGILAAFPECSEDEKDLITPEEFAEKAKKEILFLKSQYSGVDAGVEIRNDITGLMVSQGNLMIGSNAIISRERAEALIQHEVGTHILTYYNGKAQPLKQLYSGSPGYEELQEGLAVLAEYFVGGINEERLRTLAARVVAIHALIEGGSFIDVFRLLKEKYNFTAYSSFSITTRVFRSGGFTKDAVYLRGLVSLLEYLKEGHEIEPLLIGKIRQDYIPFMQELIYRKVLKPVPIKPRYLKAKGVKKKMEKLRGGMTVYNLLEN
ncbi:MAG: flavohemoglobin expression-modulating QEGLA motif protein [Bacteroidia bacterium]